jgi:2-phospho-L-lactate guanylyltransferase
MPVDLLMPVKPLRRAKTRLRGVVQGGGQAGPAHARLVLALARDTTAAAAAAAVVRRVVVICCDDEVASVLARDGADVLRVDPATDLNQALRHAETAIAGGESTAALAALPADLPALRSAELDAALRQGLAVGCRAFCADRAGTGTTLLLAPPGGPLRPCFGPGSAAAHRASGAWELLGDWPGLRCDVDTAADLAVALELGLGCFTQAALEASPRSPGAMS